MTVHTLHCFDRRTLLSAGAASLLTAHLATPARAASSGLKVTVVTGSPHRHGSSFLLTDEFIRGAKEVGAEVYRFDAAFKRVTACSGCDHCGLGAADCVYRDDMFELNPHLIDADLKLVIDRFYAINSQLHSPRKAVLLATAWNSNDWTFPALAHHYETLVRYMGWEDVGQILGTSCGTRSQTESTEFPRLAYELGKKVCARA